MVERVEAEPVTVVTRDDWSLSGRLWMGRMAARRSVLFLPAIGTTQRYLRWLAEDLATRGWGVMTFDYRGVGTSRGARDVRAISADDWVDADIPAAVETLRQRTRADFVGVLAHSLGGQLFGLSPVSRRVDGALLLAAQRGIPRFYTGKARFRLEYAYRVFPLLIRLMGELPVTRMAFPEACPPEVVRQWVRWGREGVFRDMGGENLEGNFARFQGPLVSVRVEDDHADAPAASVEALERLFVSARMRRETLEPKDFGLERIGHFGAFSPKAPAALWQRLAGWLRWLEAVAPPREDRTQAFQPSPWA